MGRIDETFRGLRKKREKALITFITAGDPDLETTGELIRELGEAGADIIELGIPFSDPMADGATIQLSSERSLNAGTTLPKILDMVRSTREKTDVPIVLFGYYNPVLAYGVERFATDAASAGVDGILLVDLPLEEAEAEGFSAVAREQGLDLIFLLAPTSDKERIAKVARKGRGFLYYVSVTGVTGARADVSSTLASEVEQVRSATSLPLVIGFGISDPQQAGIVAGLGEGVVVGSALVRLFEKHQGLELKEKAREFVASLKSGIRSTVPAV